MTKQPWCGALAVLGALALTGAAIIGYWSIAPWAEFQPTVSTYEFAMESSRAFLEGRAAPVKELRPGINWLGLSASIGMAAQGITFISLAIILSRVTDLLALRTTAPAASSIDARDELQ